MWEQQLKFAKKASNLGKNQLFVFFATEKAANLATPADLERALYRGLTAGLDFQPPRPVKYAPDGDRRPARLSILALRRSQMAPGRA
jgi:hypothetical protein